MRVIFISIKYNFIRSKRDESIGGKSFDSIRLALYTKTPLVDVLVLMGYFRSTLYVYTHSRSRLRASGGPTGYRSRRSLLKRHVTGGFGGREGGEGTYFVFVLLYLRYPLPIYPSRDLRVRVRTAILILLFLYVIGEP